MPGCYQVNDRKRHIAERTPTRKECGLPEQGFVFCSFNNSYKITPEFFDIWMRLLDKVEGSVLWLFRDNPPAEQNLRREAAARGIDPVRLVFADRLPLAEHLARHSLADLVPRHTSGECSYDGERCALGGLASAHLSWERLCRARGGEPP